MLCLRQTKLVDIQTTVEITRKHAEFGGKRHKFSKRWSEITKAGLAERDNYKTPHLDVAHPLYN
jgi:hypothetical protein